MVSPLGALGLILLAPALAGLSGIECREVAAAHERLLASSFVVERDFRLSVNDALKRRELARLEQSNGVLDTTVIEEEILSKSIVFDGDGDPALDIGFACDRTEALSGERFALASEDGTETAEFVLDSARQTLRPAEWRLETTERFLFKKLVIEGVARYERFEWRDETGPSP